MCLVIFIACDVDVVRVPQITRPLIDLYRAEKRNAASTRRNVRRVVRVRRQRVRRSHKFSPRGAIPFWSWVVSTPSWTLRFSSRDKFNRRICISRAAHAPPPFPSSMARSELKESGDLLNRCLQHLEPLMSRRLGETIRRDWARWI